MGEEYAENDIEGEADYIQQTSDGGYFMKGCYNCDSYPSYDWLVKLDNIGGITWQKTYPASFFTMAQTLDGGYVLAGRCDSELLLDIFDACLIKLDSNGAISWQKAYGLGSPFAINETAYSVQQTVDEGYIVAGKTTVSGCSGCAKVLILKLDISGNILWQQTYRGFESIAYSILQTEDNSGYLAVGSIGDEPNVDALVLKLDNNGDILWQKAYDSNENEIALSVKQISGSGYIIVGGYAPWLYKNYEGMWLMEIDSSGAIVRQKMCETCNASAFDQTSEDGYIFAGTTSLFGAGMGDMIALKLDNNWEVPNCNLTTNTDFTAYEPYHYYQGPDVTALPISETLGDTTVVPQDTSAETSVVCCYDTEDNDNDCVQLEEDNCPYHYDPLQEDTYPPQTNGCGDACECEGNFDDDEDQDGSDAATFKVDFGRSIFLDPCINSDLCNGDFECDGDVDGTDAANFKEDFGRSPFSNPCPICPTDPWCTYP